MCIFKQEKQVQNHPEPLHPVNVGKAMIKHHRLMVYTSLYMFILPVMVKLGMAYYCFTKFTHINLICRPPFVVLKADGQTVEGGQYFVTSRHLQNQSLKTLMCLRNSFLGVFTSKQSGERFDDCC